MAFTQAPAVRRISFGPWLWSPRLDLALFAGSAVLALALVAVGKLTGIERQPFPDWGWVLFVLGIDVAHVYATLFRTYLDPGELRTHPFRYTLAPLSMYLIGYWLYSLSSLTFWRCFAYIAVFHFIRQQVGWVAIYRAKSEHRSRVDRWVDDFAVYAATLYPLVYWHAHLSKTHFAWFVEGDFVDLGTLAAASLPACRFLWWAALVSFGVRQIAVFRARATFSLGKVAVVASTTAIWYVGIVMTNSDFAFTVTNVLVHGIPYFALLWAYTRAQHAEQGSGLGCEIARNGLVVFLSFLLALAFAEEFLWDQLVFHERPWLFGASAFQLSPHVLGFVVPLLMLPQATHYVLDGMLWRRGDTRRSRAQRRALGLTARYARDNS